MIGTIIKAVIPSVTIGEVCLLRNPGQQLEMQAEVVRLLARCRPADADRRHVRDLQRHRSDFRPDARTWCRSASASSDACWTDSDGRSIGRLIGPLVTDHFYPVFAQAPDPLKRLLIHKPLSLGVRALDGVLTCGEGQRMGVFAAAGGGKSTLMGMMVKGADVDVTVVALIGERGREVREFLEHELGEEGAAQVDHRLRDVR